MGFTFNEKTITVGEQSYTFRELTVGENDFCADASKGPDGVIDGRKMMRLMIVKSAIEPKLSAEELLDVPNRIYIKFCEVVNDLTSPEEEEEKAEGNA